MLPLILACQKVLLKRLHKDFSLKSMPSKCHFVAKGQFLPAAGVQPCLAVFAALTHRNKISSIEKDVSRHEDWVC